MLIPNTPPNPPTQTPSTQISNQLPKSTNTLNNNNLKVRANNGGVYLDSDWSAPFEYTSTSQLPAPTNLVLSNGILTWDAVEHSTKYEIQLNDLVYETEGNTQSLLDLQPGNYDIKVRAVGDSIYLTSDWSTIVQHTVTSKLSTPINLNVADNTLSWDAVDNAVSYEIEINGDTDNVQVSTTNTLALTNLTTPGIYSFRVRAIGDGHVVLKILSLDRSI
ncbi:MAG: hypothetical protein LBK70_03550 [Clostridiales bacterium]|jgi:predicted NAD/FAD-dependent oxidoreductase|nr:hypothetical protein [Clostridiales bacterium]